MQLYHRWKCPWCAAARQGLENVGRRGRADRGAVPARGARRRRGPERPAAGAGARRRRPGDRRLPAHRPSPLRDLRRAGLRPLGRRAGRRPRRGWRITTPAPSAAPHPERPRGGFASRPAGRRAVPGAARRRRQLVRPGGRAGAGAPHAAHLAVRARATRWPTTGTAPRRRSTTWSPAARRRSCRRCRRVGRGTATGSACRSTRLGRIQNTTDREAVWLTIGAPPGDGIADGIRLDPATGEEIPRT